MPKEFYTEKDIEDMVKRGQTSLDLTDDVVLTELAYEKARVLGMELRKPSPIAPPSAPVRPYMSQKQAQPVNGTAHAPAARSFAPVAPLPAAPSMSRRTESARGDGAHRDGADLHQRIRSAVMARLGTQIDSNLLDAIIKRVLNATGVR